MENASASDILIFGVIVGLRLVVPLAIPRYPLPGILVRLRWDPRRLNRGLVLRAAAFIWIVIKLPQEYVIHIAQVSSIDWIKVNIFGVEITAAWGRRSPTVRW